MRVIGGCLHFVFQKRTFSRIYSEVARLVEVGAIDKLGWCCGAVVLVIGLDLVLLRPESNPTKGSRR